MKTVCIECRQYDEWEPEIQKKIVEKHRDINVKYSDWDEWEIQYWKDELAKMGYEGIEIAYSGFWSQGDGASFTGYIDMCKWLEYIKYSRWKWIKRLLESGKIDVQTNIKRDRWYHYVHWNTTSVYIDWAIVDNKYPRLWEYLQQVEEDVTKHHQQLNKEIYTGLEQAYDGLCTDEAVIETLRANEYEMDASGKIM